MSCANKNQQGSQHRAGCRRGQAASTPAVRLDQPLPFLNCMVHREVNCWGRVNDNPASGGNKAIHTLQPSERFAALLAARNVSPHIQVGRPEYLTVDKAGHCYHVM